jgi:hypothetical protein
VSEPLVTKPLVTLTEWKVLSSAEDPLHALFEVHDPWSLWFQGNPHGQSLEEIGVVLVPCERLRRQRIGPHFLVFIAQLCQPAFERGRVIVRSSNEGEYGRGHAILLTLGVNLRCGGKAVRERG